MSPRVPDLLVEKVFLSEATEAERARVMADPDAVARLREMPMENARFLVANPPEDLVPRIENRARIAAARETATRRTGAIGGALLVPLFAVALAMVVVVAPGQSTKGPDQEPTTAKGLGARLHVYRQTADGPRRLAVGTVARAGDSVQLGLVAGQAKHGVVFSFDGAGGLTQHFPSGDGNTGLSSGERPLPDAYVLDAAPDFERFLLVTDDEPIDVADVRAAIEAFVAGGGGATGAVPLAPGLQQTSFLLRKEER